MNFSKKMPQPDAPIQPLPLINAATLQTRYAEAFRTLRTNIHFSLVDKDFTSLLVTSAGAGEGKTNTVANLAFTMAQAGRSVLMIDCDLRRPSLTKVYDVAPGLGLTGLMVNLFGKSVNHLAEEPHTIFDVLQLIGFQKKTGRLQVKNRHDELEIFFRNGELIDLNWLTRPAEKKLGQVLVEHGHLSQEQVELAMRRQQGTGDRLGLIVARMKLLAEPEIKGVLTFHVLEVMNLLVEMTGSSFVFADQPAAEINSSIGELLDLKKLWQQASAGRENLLLIDGGIRKSIIRLHENLHLLPAGNIPPNPSELLSSARLGYLLERLRTMYDLLIIDSPPLLPASDAQILAPHVDGVLLVVKAGLVSRDLVAHVAEQLRATRANLLGVVLNQVDTKREGYYKYYYKYYSSYYGEKS